MNILIIILSDHKLFKKGKQDMLDTAGEIRTNS